MSRGILHIEATNCPLFYIVYFRFRKNSRKQSQRLLLADCLDDWVCTETLQQLIGQRAISQRRNNNIIYMKNIGSTEKMQT